MRVFRGGQQHTPIWEYYVRGYAEQEINTGSLRWGIIGTSTNTAKRRSFTHASVTPHHSRGCTFSIDIFASLTRVWLTRRLEFGNGGGQHQCGQRTPCLGSYKSQQLFLRHASIAGDLQLLKVNLTKGLETPTQSIRITDYSDTIGCSAK